MTSGRKIEDHYAHARHNEALISILIEEVIPRHPEFYDWTLVVMEYAAFHYTKAKLLGLGAQDVKLHRSHRDVTGAIDEVGHNDLVSDHLGEDAAVAYRELYFRGQEVRYRRFYTKFTDPKQALQALALQRVHLDTIRQVCT
jgi:HEPN domain